MLHDFITTALGLVVGLLVGYYFEWRNTRAARQQNAELVEKLKTLRESIYAVGRGVDDFRQQSAVASEGNLENEVEKWVLAYQGPDGTIPKMRVLQRFLDSGHAVEQVNSALVKLDERGVLRIGEVIEVQ